MTETTSNTPETLLKDPNSMAFFILRDETVAIAKREGDLPYGKNDSKYRATYLSAGRFSPEFKKVIFYSNPVNPNRAMEILREEMHIDETYTFQVQGGGVISKSADVVAEDDFNHLTGVRKRGIQVLVEKGLKVQKSGNSSSIDKEKQ
jgi:hypothetical protein